MKTATNNIIKNFKLVIITILISSCSSDKAVKRCPKEHISIRFALASDGHYDRNNEKSKIDYSNLVNALNIEANENKLDFIFLLGDLVQDDTSYLTEVREILKDLQVDPILVKGNHDVSSSKHWASLLGYEDNFVIEYGDYLFVLLNTSDELGAYLCPDNDWLKKTLKQYKSTPNVFLFMHISPLGTTPESIYCTDFIDLIEASNIKCMFFGHDHEVDNFYDFKGIKAIWDGHFGGSGGVDYMGYRIFNIYEDGTICTCQKNTNNARLVNSNTFVL